MELKLYLVKNRIKIREFSEKLGCNATHLGEIINGKKKAGLTLAKFIEEVTNGEVKAEEILNVYQSKGNFSNSAEKSQHMELKLYLVKNRIKIREFSEKLGCSPKHLSEIINGKKKAGLTLAKFIEEVTNREVKAEEVLNAYQSKGNKI